MIHLATQRRSALIYIKDVAQWSVPHFVRVTAWTVTGDSGAFYGLMALPITDAELRGMATLAIIGLSYGPVQG
jgi:hypothetical protein